MGFPVIGETIEFFKPYNLDQIPPFVNKRMLKHGSLFRTSILRSKTIVTTDAEVNFEIFKQENKCFIMSYPEAVVRIFGKDNLFFKQDKDFHRYMRQIALQLLGPECLKQSFIHKIDIATCEHLKSDSCRSALDDKDTIGRMILEQMIQRIISDIKPENKNKLIENFRDFSFDLVRSPLDPSFWKALYTGLMARRSAMKMIKQMFKERIEEASSNEIRYGDFMEILTDEVEKEGDTVNEERCAELILSLLIASVVHYDSAIYEKPSEFNQWRWEGKELLSGSKTFMAFGGGARLCAGADFARLHIAIFLHHLITKYNFTLIQKPDIIRAPLLRFSNHIRINMTNL